jgi:hypothetical protein
MYTAATATATTTVDKSSYEREQNINSTSDPSVVAPGYVSAAKGWSRVRDCIRGEQIIKEAREKYLPRPSGMTGEYASAYDAYIERAHFPQVCSYALQGALGVIVSKLPEFNVPTELDYILKEATKDGSSIQQLFLDIIIEILTTGRCPVIVDIVPATNQFKFVRYNAESLINWKSEVMGSEKNIILGVLKEAIPSNTNVFSHDVEDVYRVLHIEDGVFKTKLFGDNGEFADFAATPSYMGKTLDEIPMYIAGSISNSVELQPVPLLSVANCSVQIYRKEADLANSEYLSCNPTLVMAGASNDDDLPNVVGSSVMIVLPDAQARVFYTQTDTAALQHVKEHISDLYEEAIRHGVAILDTRNGVESAEALRIRQATQSASIYSIYLSALNAIRSGLYTMCDWAGLDKSKVIIDAPSALTYGIPDSNVMREIIDGFGKNIMPLSIVHRYLVGNGLLDQTTSLSEYVDQLIAQKDFIAENITLNPKAPVAGQEEVKTDANGMPIVEDPPGNDSGVVVGKKDNSKSTKKALAAGNSASKASSYVA